MLASRDLSHFWGKSVVRVFVYGLHFMWFLSCLLWRVTLEIHVVQSVGNRVGVVEPFLMRMAHGAPMRTANRSRDNTKGLMGRVGMTNHNMLSDEQTLRMCKRFYVALILSRLVQVCLIVFAMNTGLACALLYFRVCVCVCVIGIYACVYLHMPVCIYK